jgi:hypothetical protein
MIKHWLRFRLGLGLGLWIGERLFRGRNRRDSMPSVSHERSVWGKGGTVQILWGSFGRCLAPLGLFTILLLLAFSTWLMLLNGVGGG